MLLCCSYSALSKLWSLLSGFEITRCLPNISKLLLWSLAPRAQHDDTPMTSDTPLRSLLTQQFLGPLEVLETLHVQRKQAAARW